MMLTKRVNYGIRGLLNLAKHDRQSFLKRISQEEQIPESYLAKIFQVFVQRGILESKKGPNGGFTLAVDLNEITVGKIVECLEGAPNLDRCPFDHSCERRDRCPLYQSWRSNEAAKLEALHRIRITELGSGCMAA
jgi:Rrf2 family protein